jgi:hypothetical protein
MKSSTNSMHEARSLDETRTRCEPTDFTATVYGRSQPLLASLTLQLPGKPTWMFFATKGNFPPEKLFDEHVLFVSITTK